MIPQALNSVNRIRKKLSLFDKYSERHSAILGAMAGTLSAVAPDMAIPITVGIFAVAMGVKTEKVRQLGISKTKGLKEVLKDPWYFAGLWTIMFYVATVAL